MDSRVISMILLFLVSSQFAWARSSIPAPLSEDCDCIHRNFNTQSLNDIVNAIQEGPRPAAETAVQEGARPRAQDVAIIDGESRLPISQGNRIGLSPSEIEMLRGAVGRLKCGGFTSTAFVAGNRNQIVASRHALVENGQLISRSGCVFELFTDPMRTIRLRSGDNDILTGGNSASRDFAIIKLEEPISGTPLPLLPADSPVTPGAAQIAVSGAMTRLPRRVSQNDLIVQRCQINSQERTFAAPFLRTNCDFTPGSSGSPILQRTPNGLAVTGLAKSEGNGGDGTYNEERERYSTGLGIQGVIHNSIRQFSER